MSGRYPTKKSNKRIIRSLTHDPHANSMLLGCAVCPTKSLCGGLCVSDHIVDCLGLCCGNPDHCTRVCANVPRRYVDQLHEIGGFDLGNVPRAPKQRVSFADEIIPLVYHGGSRVLRATGGIFALRFSDLIDFKNRTVRFSSSDELRSAFRIDPMAQIVLTGVNHDRLIEPWWTLGDDRLRLIESIRQLDIAAITTPNFSLVLNHPRTDDLHALKRIAITFSEFQQYGILTALHPNGRTDVDFDRWAAFIAERDEISLLAYEFITGPGTVFRRQFHLESLAKLATAAGRPLDIIVRGDPRVIPYLRQHYSRVIYIETTAFIKTLKRQRAARHTNSGLQWNPDPTASGQYVDRLYSHNNREQSQFLRSAYYSDNVAVNKAA